MPEHGQDGSLFAAGQIIRFGRFELDPSSGELRRHGARIRLQEQPLRILLMLLEHPGELVSREQIRQRLWPDGTFVDSDHSINAAIKRLRDALGESVTRQRHLQTLPRRGYRFLGEICWMPAGTRSAVGRAKERARLLTALASANAGHGLLLCVSGEPGIGKTTLVEQFLAQAASAQRYLAGRARCSERLAGTEAWLPWLDMLESLLASASRARSKNGQSLAQTLKDLAPTWGVLLAPAITPSAGADVLSQERLKREMRAFLEEASRLEPIVLFMDDLHWAAASSVDLLIYLVDRLETMRVLIVVAYRTSDLALTGHPFLHAKPDLEAHGRCDELALGFLSSEEIAAYVALQFPGHRFPVAFLDLVREKTEGSPLFMASMLRDLRERAFVGRTSLGWELKQPLERIAKGVPVSLQDMIRHKFALLHEYRSLLLVAAVQGYEFDSAVIAHVLGTAATKIEEQLLEVESTHHFIESISEQDLSGQTPSQRYRFVHVLYQNVLYASLGPARRAAISRAVAEALEANSEPGVGKVSTELALLFEAARDPIRAAHYFRMASEHAVARAANLEAVALGERGLKLLAEVPPSPERDRLELWLYTTFGGALIATHGYDSAETVRVFTRAQSLSSRYGDLQQRAAVAWGLACVHSVKGDAPEGFAMAKEMLRLADAADDTALRVAAHYALGDLFYWRPSYKDSTYHFNQAVTLYRQPLHHAVGQACIGYDPGVASAGFLALVFWYLGFPDEAVRRVTEAAELARPLNAPICTAMIDFFAAIVHNLRQEPERAVIFAKRALTLSRQEGFDYFQAGSLVQLGQALSLLNSVDEGMQLVREGVKLNEAIGGKLERPYFLFALGECLGRAGRGSEAVAVLDEGIEIGRRAASQFHEPELLCLKARLLTSQSVWDRARAEECVREALRMTRATGAKSLELRAAIELNRLPGKRGGDEEREALAGVVRLFTEGFDTKDLRTAHMLLGAGSPDSAQLS